MRRARLDIGRNAAARSGVAAPAESDLLGRVSLMGLVVFGAATVMFLLVVARVGQLQIAPPEDLRRFIDDRKAVRLDMAPRGDLLDRRGRLLATTRVGQRIFVDPHRFPEPYDQSIVVLARAAGLDADVVGRRVMSRVAENEIRRDQGRSPIRYVSVGGILEDWQAEAVSQLRMRGVHLERRSVREVPGEGIAASIVGKVGVDHDGLLGAEHAFDSLVRPESGRRQYVHDAAGRPLWVEAGSLRGPKRGEDVRLSIDMELQRICLEELQRGIEEADAAGGRLVMMDPHTGEILAMLDLIRDVSAGSDVDGEGGQRPGSARKPVIPVDPRRDVHPALGRNRCVEDAYEPGSTFKPFMWAAVTELELARPDEMINTHAGRWRTSYGRSLEDVVRLDKQSWRDVLVNSSNIGMAQVTERLSARQMREAALRFGFGQRTGVGLPGESNGIVTTARNWNKFTHTSVAMGYEVADTPVQMTRAFSAFARNGELAGTMPRARMTAYNPRTEPDEPIHRVLPSWTAHLTRETMRGVGENLDRRLRQAGVLDRPPRYEIFGKSGTALAPRLGARGYLERQYVSSFIAGAPVDRPRIVLVVVIDDPGPDRVRTRTHFGSAVAGPVVRRVMDRSLEYLGVAPTRPDAREDRVASTHAPERGG